MSTRRFPFLLYLLLYLYPLNMQAVSKNVKCPLSCECDSIFGLKEVACGNLTHIPSDVPEDTNVLDLSACYLSHIPIKPLERLFKLQILTIREINTIEANYNLTSLDLPILSEIIVDGSDLTSIPQLLPSYISTLSIAENNIGTLKSGSFRNYPDLETLLLWDCMITHLEAGVFDEVPSLSYIEFNSNNLTDDSFPFDIFKKNQALDSVSLFANNLKHVLTDLPSSLSLVDYSSNTITELRSHDFKSTPNLMYLYLQQNMITNIEDFAFEGLDKVISLDLSYNNIQELRKYTLAGLGVKELKLTSNNISHLEDFTFQNMADLQQMDISYNHISAITDYTFTGLKSLLDLNLSYNWITNITQDAFKPLQSMAGIDVYLSFNRLQSLRPEVFTPLPKESNLMLAGNLWNCDCHLRWLREAMDNATYTIEQLYSLKCATPAKLAGKSLIDLQPKDFVCVESDRSYST